MRNPIVVFILSCFIVGAANAGQRDSWQEAVDSLGQNNLMNLDPVIRSELTGNTQVYMGLAAVESAAASLSAMDTIMDQTRRFDLSAQGDAGQWRPPASGESRASRYYNASNRLPGALLWRTWAEYIGSREERRGGDAGYDYRSTLNGTVVGSALQFSPDATLGLRFAYSDIVSRSSNLQSKVKTRLYSGGAYAILRPADRFTIDLDFAYGRFDNEMDRENLSGLYSSDFNQNTRSGGVRATYDVNLSRDVRFSPFAGFRYHHISQGAFAESDLRAPGGLANVFDEFSGASFSTTVGATLAHEVRLSDGRAFTPSFQAAVRREWADRNYLTAGRFGDSPNRFSVSSLKGKSSSIELGMNLKTIVYKGKNAEIEIQGGYKVKIKKNDIKHDWYAGMELRF